MQETWVRSLGREDPLEEGLANPFHYSCLESPHGQKSLAGCSPRCHKGVGHDLATKQQPGYFLTLISISQMKQAHTEQY